MSAHGRHVWYELMTNAPEAAKTFYGDVVGWTTQEMPMPGGTYTCSWPARRPLPD